MILPQVPAVATPQAMQEWARQLVAALSLDTSEGSSGSSLVAADGVPIGTPLQWAGDVVPDNYLECAGQLLSRTEYGELFRAIGTKWNTGGEAADVFRLPDGRGRFAVGADGTLPLSGGSSTKTITQANLPSALPVAVTDPGHTHAFTGTPHGHAATSTPHIHTVNGATAGANVGVAAGAVNIKPAVVDVLSTDATAAAVTVTNATAGGTNANAASGITAQINGSDTPLDVMPPYLAFMWIIKAR